MKIRLELTDEAGRFYEGEVELTERPAPNRSSRATRSVAVAASKEPSGGPELNFDEPIRPFLKAFAKGRSGPAKFTLLVAYLAKGKIGVAIQKSEIERAWGKVTGHLGTFNPAYTTRAKDGGWVDSPKNGQYVLMPSWRDALGK